MPSREGDIGAIGCSRHLWPGRASRITALSAASAVIGEHGVPTGAAETFAAARLALSAARRIPIRAAFPAPHTPTGVCSYGQALASLAPLPGAQSEAHRKHRNPVRSIGYPLPVVTQWSSTAPMICREFRDLHPAFLDDTLSAHDVVEMQLHLAECVRCSRYDTAMRRGLMVLRNLPPLEPSSDFIERLNQKLLAAQDVDARAEHYRGPGIGTFLATAASVVIVGFLAAMVFDVAQPARDLRLPPVIAVRPPMTPTESPSGVNSAFVASASMGLPVWPAAVMAEQAQEHFAAEELGR